MKRTNIFGWILALVVLALIILTVLKDAPVFGAYASNFALQLQALGLLGFGLFLLTCTVSTAAGFPRQFFAFVAGFAYGPFLGVLVSSVGAIAGCAITFSVSRRWFRHRVARKWPNQVAWLNKLLDSNAFLKILVLRFQPLGTNFLTNLSAGLTSISARDFLLASWLGYLPQMLVFSLMGSGIRVGSTEQLVVSLVLLVVSIAIGWYLYQQYKHQLS